MFTKLLQTQFPRLLSQACRDVNSPFYGCFDRNWWHYRIRDFASIMLQQGGYTAYQYSKLESFEAHGKNLKELARASALFWNKRAKKRGAFEEYYPWEQGYPPLAFSTLAMAKLVLEEVIHEEEIVDGLKKAARQLQHRFESQAGNQQVAGLAALATIRKINPELVEEENYLQLKEKTLALQDEEGWYTEYDGPDLGYLSVTLDCLWDLYDISGDEDYLQSARRAMDFLYGFISNRNAGAGMHNARNTDYIVPYGLCRFMQSKEEATKDKASLVFNSIYHNIDDPGHFFHAIDDRYWSHYIGHSLARAQLIIEDLKPGKRSPEKATSAKSGQAGSALLSFSFTNSGYIFRSLNTKGLQLLVSGKKGSIFSIFNSDNPLLSDFGWIAFSGKKQYVNHWWSKDWNISEDENSIEVSGALYPHKEKTSTPILHSGLRLVSFFFGSRLTKLLRKVLIFKDKKSNIGFARRIEITKNEIEVTDTLTNVGKHMRIERAPRSSKRHVASADSWHREDWHPGAGLEIRESIESREGKMIVRTTIPF